MGKVTIADIAKRAGVSVSTVSRVLNGKVEGYMRPETHARVVKAIEELGYKPNRLAQALRGAPTKIIGFVIPDRLNPYFQQLTLALERIAYKSGYGIILCSSDNSLEKERTYLELLERQRVDGIIFSTVGSQKEEINRLIARGLAVVLADEEVVGVNAPVVVSDNYLGGRQATEHLISLGHERIACITGPLNLISSRERLRGYRDALEDAGIPLDEALIIECRDFSYDEGYKTAKKLLRRKVPFSAVVCANDLVALAMIRALGEQGRDVPADCSVVGFDNSYLAELAYPRLTTVAQPVAHIVRKVFVLLEKILSGEHVTGVFRLRTKLVVRDTTAPFEGPVPGKGGDE
ncbi:LacI family DNA-binding transcriptional regulator [Candidatus Bipolaricaulota sp. J31]